MGRLRESSDIAVKEQLVYKALTILVNTWALTNLARNIVKLLLKYSLKYCSQLHRILIYQLSLFLTAPNTICIPGSLHLVERSKLRDFIRILVYVWL